MLCFAMGSTSFWKLISRWTSPIFITYSLSVQHIFTQANLKAENYSKVRSITFEIIPKSFEYIPKKLNDQLHLLKNTKRWLFHMSNLQNCRISAVVALQESWSERNSAYACPIFADCGIKIPPSEAYTKKLLQKTHFAHDSFLIHCISMT